MTSQSSGNLCNNCGNEIEGQPLHPSRDIKPKEDGSGLTYVDDPDGPFCDVDCRREFDDE